MPKPIDQQSCPSFSPSKIFLFHLGSLPETVSKIKAIKDKKESESPKEVKKYTSPGQGISIPLFLE